MIRLSKCREFVHSKICHNKKEHATIRCRTVESLDDISGLRVLRWIETHPRDRAYPELLLHSAVCWSEDCDMKAHAKRTQGKIVDAMRLWVKKEG